jgi:hypothetical protein
LRRYVLICVAQTIRSRKERTAALFQTVGRFVQF